MDRGLLFAIVLGGLAGMLLLLETRKQKKTIRGSLEMGMNKQSESKSSTRQLLKKRWSVRLALVGCGLGILAALSRGYTEIGFIIGFSIPQALVLGFIGFLIDVFRRRKTEG